MSKTIQFLFLLLGIAFSNCLLAQEITFHKTTVKVDDEPFCLIQEEGMGLISHYTISNLEGEELIFAKHKSIETSANKYYYYYQITFLPTKEVIEMDNAYNFKRQFLKALFVNKVIQGDTLSPAGMEKFKIKYAEDCTAKAERKRVQSTTAPPAKNIDGEINKVVTEIGSIFSTTPRKTTPTTSSETVERNRLASISVFGNTIKQGGEDIGFYKKDSEATAGKIYQIYTISHPNGTVIAELRKETFADAGILITFPDRREMTFTFDSRLDSKNIEKIAAELVRLRYL
jgi:hypothetical protein